jgi:hypothetical protein
MGSLWVCEEGEGERGEKSRKREREGRRVGKERERGEKRVSEWRS